MKIFSRKIWFLGFIILGFANSTVTFLVLQGTLLSWGMAAGFGLTVHTAVANWFRKRRTIAFAIISAAVVLPGFFTPTQAYNTIIEQFSRQGTFIGLGSLMLMIGIPLALLFRHRPEQHGYLPTGQESHTKRVNITIPIEQNHMTEVNLTLRQALRSRAFWLLAVALTLESLVVSISSAVRVEYQVDFMGKSGLALVEDNIWWGIFSLIGILLFGLLGDKFAKRHLLAAAVILRCISFVVLLSVGSVQWYMNGLLFYMGAGIPVLTYAIIADYFGRRSFATIVAFSSVIRLIIMIPVVGGLWFPIGWLLNISGSNKPLIAFAVVGGIVSAILFLLVKPPRDKTQEEIVADIP